MKILSKLRSSVILGIGLCLMGSGYGSGLSSRPTLQEQAPAYPYTLNDDEFTVASAMYAEQKIFNGCGNVLAFKGKLQDEAEQWILLQSKLLTNAATEFEGILRRKGKTVKFFSGFDVISLVGGLDSDTKDYLDKLIQGRSSKDDKIINQDEKEWLKDIISALGFYADSCDEFSKPSDDNCSYFGNNSCGYGITQNFNKPGWSGWDNFIWFLRKMCEEIENSEKKGNDWGQAGRVKTVLGSMLAWLNTSDSDDKISLKEIVKLDVLTNTNEEIKKHLNCVKAGIFWFKYALHTEIQLAVLQSKGIITLLDNYHIISLKQLCISCERGAPLRKWPLFVFVKEDTDKEHILHLNKHYSSQEFKNKDDLGKSVILYTYNI